MDSNMIRSELRKLSELVEGWTASGRVPAVERDMALGKLRTLYELVRFGSADSTGAAMNLGEALSLDGEAPAAMLEASPEAAPEATPETPQEATPEPVSEPNPEPVPEPSPEPEPAPAPEPLPAEEPVAAVSEPEPTPEPAPAAEQPDSEQEPDTIFGLDDETADRHRQKQRLIMSLYDAAPADRGPRSAAALSEELTNSVAEIVAEDEEAEYPEPEFAAAETEVAPVSAPAPVLGDVIGHDRQTLADTIAPPHDIASELRRGEPVDDLHRAIGINDKFLMIRDLFDGDEAAFERVIGELNARADLDDCMIHIAENYAWNPDSDGAKLLMELLERKFA